MDKENKTGVRMQDEHYVISTRNLIPNYRGVEITEEDKKEHVERFLAKRKAYLDSENPKPDKSVDKRKK